MTWSVEQVEALAPDAAAVKAGRGLATPRRWSARGCDERAVWGSCQGSGTSRYDTCVDLAGPAFRCSCPSRKIPCKHVLGLLLAWAGGERGEGATAPGWVAAWLASRDARAAAAAQPAAQQAGPDPEAQARRAAARMDKIDAGMAELDLWLRDLVRAGLAGARAQPASYWETTAARLVDAQAPGAAAQVRRMGALAARGDAWPSRLLDRAGRLHLLAAGWRRRDALPEPVQADLRTALGWAWPKEEVAGRTAERGRWAVLGQHREADERLLVQRSWLWDQDGRPALVLEFAAAGQPLPADLVVGTIVDADLAFYPGSAPLRALVVRRHAAPVPVERFPAASVDAALRAHAAALAADPWLERYPFALDAVVPVRRDDGWALRDAGGLLLPLAGSDAARWTLLAVSGGRPVGVTGEWREQALHPLAAWAEGRLVALP